MYVQTLHSIKQRHFPTLCRSEVQQNMPLPIASLRKSTEPWLDEYFALDLEGVMQEAGFSDIVYVPVNHRHRVMLGVAS